MKYSVFKFAWALLASLLLSQTTAAADETVPVAVSGYDLVSYHNSGEPTVGNGHHLVTHNGVNYLFSSKANRRLFQKNPNRFLPAYGGYCAFGVSVGKKFYGDPNVWRIVDGKLYLNLDKKIQKRWEEDVAGNIEKADKLWNSIRNVAAADL